MRAAEHLRQCKPVQQLGDRRRVRADAERVQRGLGRRTQPREPRDGRHKHGDDRRALKQKATELAMNDLNLWQGSEGTD